MGKNLPLPKSADLPEVVVFHRSDPSDQRLMLQVPTGTEESETYLVRLDKSEHRQWVGRLTNSQALMDRLSFEMHVAYYPHRNGTVMTLEDPYEIPWLAKVLAHARAQQSSPMAGYFSKRQMRQRTLPVPALKRALGARGGAQW